MDRLTTILIIVAVAIAVLAARDARRPQSAAAAESEPAQPVRTPPAGRPSQGIDDGMVILRNDPIDNGMLVRSPFDEDPGIVRAPEIEGE